MQQDYRQHSSLVSLVACAFVASCLLVLAARHPDDGLLFKHEACERAILECTRTLPTELEQLMGTEGKIALLVVRCRHICFVCLTLLKDSQARATLLAALIQLHSSLSATRQDSRNKCMAAATDLIEMLRVLRYMQVPATILILFGVNVLCFPF